MNVPALKFLEEIERRHAVKFSTAYRAFCGWFTASASPVRFVYKNVEYKLADAIAGEGGESGWVLKKILKSDPMTLN